MTLNENLLYNRKETLIIPRSKLILGIASGLFFAFWLYAFLYMSREVFRVFSKTEYYDLLILTDSEVFYYNLFFAFIAVIFGQSICFIYWFEKPRNFFHRYNWRRNPIVNDNRFLNWYFLSWFSKLAVVYGIFFCLTLDGGFNEFELFSEYGYLFFLTIVVLYLQVWNTFRLNFKKESKKWILISLLVISGVSLTFSKINFVDHKTFDDNFLKKNVFIKYNLKIPDSEYYKFGIEKVSLTEKVFVAMIDKNVNQSMSPQIIYKNQEIEIHEIDIVVNQWWLSRNPADAFYIDVRLYIDKAVPMGFVNDLKEELSRNSSRRVSFVVFPSDLEIERLFKYYYAIPSILTSYGKDSRAIADSLIKSNNISNVIKLKIDNSGNCFFNGFAINKNDLGIQIENELRANLKSAFLLSYADATAYSEFIYLISQIRKITHKIRNDLAIKEYGVSFDDLRFLDEYFVFIKNYPLLVFDFIEN